MGTWGIEIFEDDITMDVKDYFEDFRSKGFSIHDASVKVVNLLQKEIQDYDEGPLIYFALAKLQMENEILDSFIKNKCIECFRSGRSMERWSESGIVQFFKRRGVLKKFSKKLKAFKNVVENDNYTEHGEQSLPNIKYTVYVLTSGTSQTKYVGKTSCFDKRKKYMEELFRGYSCVIPD